MVSNKNFSARSWAHCVPLPCGIRRLAATSSLFVARGGLYLAFFLSENVLVFSWGLYMFYSFITYFIWAAMHATTIFSINPIL